MGVDSWSHFAACLSGIRAACLFDATSAELYLAGNAADDLEKKTGEAFIHGKDSDDRDSGISTRCIHVGGRMIGAIGFEWAWC